ncbi:MAG: dihydroxy-acid dehydratase [Streptosporangiaceae bacterium]
MTGLLQGLTSYSDEGFSAYLRQVFLASAGFEDRDMSRPVVGICHTMSDYTTCHRDMPQLVQAIASGVLEAGGLPMAFGSMSLPEALVEPTTMLYRNLLAMETEELIRSQPMDAVVLVGGCDKTVPAQLMAAISADMPCVQVVVGPMMTGSWRGERVGACTDCRRLWAARRAGELPEQDLREARDQLAPTAGTCMVMGTASTMAVVAEVLGLAPAGSATAPSPTGDRLRAGRRSGRLAVRVARRQLRPSALLSAGSFRNAAVAIAGVGGSTNAVIHLLAIARRTGADFTLADIEDAWRDVPVVVDCKPVGAGYFPDLHDDGGVPAVLRQLREFLDLDARTVDGLSVRDLVESGAKTSPSAMTTRVLRTTAAPVSPPGGLRILRGSLAPDGALIKAAAATLELRRHRGRAVTFNSAADVIARLDDPRLEIADSDVLVLRYVGPVAAGMPEAGAPPVPARLAQRGVRDLLRISDGRMSGTSFGSVILHVAPEAAVGGPLALVQDGDQIAVDVDAGRLDLLVDSRELRRRRAGWRPPPQPARGWRNLYARTVLQASQGADLDFLTSTGRG